MSIAASPACPRRRSIRRHQNPFIDTPTYTLVDRKGRVAFHAPTRVIETGLERLIESVLSEQ